MTSIRDLAREYGAQEHEVRAFWPDLFTLEVRGTDELPADITDAFRQAWGRAPDPTRVDAENRDADAVLDELYRITKEAGYDY